MSKILAEGNNVPEKPVVQTPPTKQVNDGQNVPERPKEQQGGNEQKKH